jgi:hypothetical protein
MPGPRARQPEILIVQQPGAAGPNNGRETVKLKNINGNGTMACRCGSWLEHWLDFGGGSVPRFCPEATCIEAPALGVPVQKEDSADQEWYVIPLCKTHAAESGKSLVVHNNIKLVLAAVIETCGRRRTQETTRWRPRFWNI